MNFLVAKEPPPNRVGKHLDTHELHMPELLVMIAAAEWLFKLGVNEVRIHPDGMHLKDIDVDAFLVPRRFERRSATGRSKKTGEFKRNNQTLILHSLPGLGDVVGLLNGTEIEIETKGGCVNSKHAGQLSKLRKGLSEAVGQAMASPRNGVRLIAVVPRHTETQKLAERLVHRCHLAGIEIGLVSEDGALELIK